MNEKRFIVANISKGKLVAIDPQEGMCKSGFLTKEEAHEVALKLGSKYITPTYGIFELVATTKTTVQTELDPVDA